MPKEGTVSGDYYGNRTFHDRINFAQGAVGASFNFIKKDTQIWYVDSGKTAPAVSGDGLTWDHAFMTLAEAVTAAGDYDTILIAPNSIQTIDPAGIEINNEGLRIIGALPTPSSQVAAIKCTGTAPVFRILVNRFEIANLCISQRGAYACIQIGSATVGAVYETYIHDCNFDGYSTCTYGIEGYLTTDCVQLVIENNYFQSHATAAIRCSGTKTTVRGNTIIVPVDTIGIMAVDAGGDRAYSIYADNYLSGIANASTGGIVFTGTPTAGTLILTRNYLCGTWNTTITDVGGGCNNYVTDASGGALINC